MRLQGKHQTLQSLMGELELVLFEDSRHGRDVHWDRALDVGVVDALRQSSLDDLLLVWKPLSVRRHHAHQALEELLVERV